MSCVHYTFDLRAPHTHLVGVTIDIPTHEGPHLDLTLPAWLPGAYKIVDNARNIRNLVAESTRDGHALSVTRLNWQTWRIHNAGDGATVRYDVFANKPEIHQGQLDANHAFLNPGTLACYIEGHKLDWSVRLSLQLPEGWYVATGLDALSATTFEASDYETFIDCPLQAGQFRRCDFEHDGIRYEVVYEGATGFDPAVLVPELEAIVATATGFWGRPPLTRYTFMYLETDAGFLNGLEHRNSTIITGPISDTAVRDGLLAITAHEFFHLWNVKRLRPLGLGPFDYTREAHTTGLWVVEGFTEYFTDVWMLRAGLRSPTQHLRAITSNIRHMLEMPGRRNMSLEEASWTTWHFGDDRWNGALNYYVKGHLLGVALDVTLRARSDNRVGLEDVMREMWTRYGIPDIPYEPRVVCDVAEELLGASLEDVWSRYLWGREDFDWDELLAPIGLQLVLTRQSPSLQLTPKAVAGGVGIEKVLAEGAAQAAGLMAGDVIVALGGEQVSASNLKAILNRHEPGALVSVHYFRRGRLHECEVTLGIDPEFTLVVRGGDGQAQTRLREAWLWGRTGAATLVG